MTPFQSWCDNTFDALAFQYRQQLSVITRTVGEHCVTGKLTPDQHTAMIELLQTVPVPTIPKFTGEVTEADRQWYPTCLKPDYKQMLEDAKTSLLQYC